MRCSLLTLSCYVDDEMDARRRGETEAHVLACIRCRAGLDHLNDEAARIGSLARVRVPDDSARTLLEQIGILGAGEDLPPRPVGDEPDAAEQPPWLAAERGPVLPWTAPPRAPRALATRHEEATQGLAGSPAPLRRVDDLSGVPAVPFDLAVIGRARARPGPPAPPPQQAAAEPPAAAPVAAGHLDPPGASRLHSEPDVEPGPGGDPPPPASLAGGAAAAGAAPAAAEPGPPAMTPVAPDAPMPSQGDADVSVRFTDPPPGVPAEPFYPLTDEDADALAAGGGPPAPAGPIPATRPTMMERLRERLAMRRALLARGDSDFDRSVEVVSGLGAPSRHGRAREDLARRRQEALRPGSTPTPAPPAPAPSLRAMLPPAARPSTGREVAAAHAGAAASGPPGAGPLAAGWRTGAVSVEVDEARRRPDLPAVGTRSADPAKPPTEGGLRPGETTVPVDGRVEARRSGPAPAPALPWPVRGRVDDRPDPVCAAPTRPSSPPPAAPTIAAPAGAPAGSARGGASPGVGRGRLVLAGVGVVAVAILAVGHLNGRTTIRSTAPSSASASGAAAPAPQGTAAGPATARAAATPAPTPAPPPGETVGAGGTGWQVRAFRFGGHITFYRVVVDYVAPAGSVPAPTMTIASRDPQTILVTMQGTAPLSAPISVPDNPFVKSITLVPGPPGTATYSIALARPGAAKVTLTPPPVRLILDIA